DSLLNGLQLIVLEQQGTGTVAVNLRVKSGAMFDLAGKGGLAEITTGKLLKRGGGRNAKKVNDTGQQKGRTGNATVGWDSTDIVVNGPADSLEVIIDLLSRIVISPSFDQKELEALKANRIAAAKVEESIDAFAVRRKELEAIFGTHPFGHPARGA